ncbi:hypothetical protein P0Y35_14845 [Kiritimatiellaeota bacterium B1221]|nr:hypothetical protein [Kiritimatiellaeota bacterium B1221]
MKSTKKIITALTLAAGLAGSVFAQPPGGGQENRTRNRNMDRAQMQQRMQERMKEELQASDEEWQVLQPLIAEVTALRGPEMRRGGGRRGNRNQEQEVPADENAVAKASRELGELLRDENASSENIKAKLDALRTARSENNAAMEAAREKLRSVVTVRQEAVLVSRGLLD